DANLQKGKLGRRMRIGPDGYPRALRRDDPEAVHIEVLAIRVRVDLERRSGLDSVTGDLLPVTGESDAEVVDAAAGMREHMDVGVLQAVKVAFGLIVVQTKL